MFTPLNPLWLLPALLDTRSMKRSESNRGSPGVTTVYPVEPVLAFVHPGPDVPVRMKGLTDETLEMTVVDVRSFAVAVFLQPSVFSLTAFQLSICRPLISDFCLPS